VIRGLHIGGALIVAIAIAGSTARADEGDQAMLRRVQDLLRAHQADIFGCVQKEPTPPEGELLVRVFVGEAGRAERPEVLKDQTHSKTLGRCLTARISGWDLSSLKAEVGDQIVFPLAFRPGAKPSQKQGPK
jgi:hypothetical protein